MNPEGGFVYSYRRMWDNPIFRNRQEAAVFAWMYHIAQWQGTTLRTRFGAIELRRGELLMAEREVAESFGMHRNTLRSLVQRLRDAEMIEPFQDRCPHRAGTVWRIVKYEEYQRLGADWMSGQDQKPTENRTTARTEAGPKKDRSRTKNKEGKEVKEGEGIKEVGAHAPPAARGTRLPSDWTLSPDLHAYAAEQGMSPAAIRREAENFHDYWTAKPGAAGRKTDWAATWRTWVRRSMERTHNGRPPHQQHRPATDNGFRALLRRELEGSLGDADDGLA